ncbi:MAG: pentapeptide repeat-containing protein [Proteobacteria bacterium]|nr:pentapeptide repeat-containing protein [Pseudomonadota bacterium]
MPAFADAQLAATFLIGADLAGADLAGADLTGVNLAGASLRGANLARANLARADLAGVDFSGAYLADTDWEGARNVPGGVISTDPPTPYQRTTAPADLVARRSERAKVFREANPAVPVIEQLDAKILAAITVDGGTLEMGTWHTCETTHCRAGWAIHLAGAMGVALELEHGAQQAGAMIYRASTGRVPHLFASNARALEDLQAGAAEQE